MYHVDIFFLTNVFKAMQEVTGKWMLWKGIHVFYANLANSTQADEQAI